MVAAAMRDGVGDGLAGSDGLSRTYVVEVPGGRLTVGRRADGHLELTGPAVLVADGEVSAALWWGRTDATTATTA
jgi:diaminopimelate epimerase